ncbi:unnamed protein product [Alternaria alternata]
MADKEPIVTHVFTADPSAHVFNGKLYVYPSHHRETDIKDNDNGDQYDMNDYHVFSMNEQEREILPLLPARDKEGIFRVGVATGDKPEGPFKPEAEPIKGSFSIDPASFVDEDGSAYLYFGGIWGGQLQCWKTGKFIREDYETMEAQSGNALCAKVAKLSDDMTSFTTDVQDVVILDESGNPIQAADHDRRFFEAAWMHKYNGKYYFSYSTGDTHFLCYATGDSPLGPFTYGGRILEPVIGWTTHHSIAEFKGKWYLFYHDSSLSKGVNHLRCVKIREIVYDEAGKIKLAESQPKVM